VKTLKGKTLLKGHALLFEGSALTSPKGCGGCSCGAFSPKLPSNSARKEWHKRHKNIVKLAEFFKELHKGTIEAAKGVTP
jgi:hypothetical protein